jgi:hypothetical protein
MPARTERLPATHAGVKSNRMKSGCQVKAKADDLPKKDAMLGHFRGNCELTHRAFHLMGRIFLAYERKSLVFRRKRALPEDLLSPVTDCE